MSGGIGRRRFLKRTLAMGASVGVPTLVSASVRANEISTSSNEQILIGFIGCGNRARQLMEQIPAPGADCCRCRLLSPPCRRGGRGPQPEMEMLPGLSPDVGSRATRCRRRSYPRSRSNIALHSCRAGGAGCLCLKNR